MEIEESAAFEAYGRSFGQRSVVVFEPRRARRKQILSPEGKARRRKAGIKNWCVGLRKCIAVFLAKDCYAIDEEKIAKRNMYRPLPPRMNGGQYEIDFGHGNYVFHKLHYVVGVPYNYSLA